MDKKHDLTTPEGFAAFMKERSDKRIKIMLSKNHDYADPSNHEDDPFKVFRNFMMVEDLGICGAGTGILVRLTDKFMRMIHLLKPGHTSTVTDEAVSDTMLDLQNYVDILAGLIALKEEQKFRNTPIGHSIKEDTDGSK